MKKSRLTAEQIVAILKRLEGGRRVPELAREIGVSAATIYAWKARFANLEPGGAHRIRGLEEENRRLKNLVADLSLDKECLKAIIQKHGWNPPA